MKKPVDAYVAQLKNGANTKGVGNQPLAPKVLADGTKEFDLTAAVIDWEVSPGKTVQAWTYNGTVPGPWIKVDVGDHVRVVLDNQLPQSTAIHFHGIEVPIAMDGVPDVTQAAGEAGREVHVRVRRQEARARHVPLAPPRGGPGARRHARRLPGRRRAAARRRRPASPRRCRWC